MSTVSKSLFVVDGSLDRPILYSQGLPLIKKLSENGHACWILSFEGSPPDPKSVLWQDLKNRGINWVPISIGSSEIGARRTQVIQKGIAKAFSLCRKESIDLIHCRSYRPAIIGSVLKKIIGTSFLFDMRGFLIDEQLALGRWRQRTIKYRIARKLEKSLILNADNIIAVSALFKEIIIGFPYFPKVESGKISIVPNCVDTARFALDEVGRSNIREEMGWTNRSVLTFVGEATRLVSFSKILELFRYVKELIPTAFLAFYVYGNLHELEQLAKSSLSPEDYCLITVKPEDIPAYLAATDVGLLFRMDNLFTQTIASPIKFAEYLAAGLPVVATKGIGDTERIINQYKVGVIIDADQPEQMQTSALKIAQLLQEGWAVQDRCRKAAQNELSLDYAFQQYEAIYRQLTVQSRGRRRWVNH